MFAEVSGLVRDAELTAGECLALHDYVHEARPDAPGVGLRRATEWVPNLAPLAQRLANEPKMLQLVVSTLLAITRSQSATRVASDTPPSK